MMSALTIFFTCAGLLVAGVIGINWSVPLQAPAVIFFGLAALCASIPAFNSGKPRWAPSAEGKASCTWLPGLILVSISYFVMRACCSPVWDLGVEDLMLIIPAAILYLITAYAMRGKAGIALRQGLAGMVMLLLLLNIGACISQLQGGEGYSLERYFSGAVRRDPQYVTGMYIYYGSFANFAVAAGLLCLSLGIWGRMAISLRALIFLLGVAGLGLALWSQSRSAALGLCAGLAVFGVMLLISVARQSAALKKRMMIIVTSLGVLGLIGVALGAVWVFSQRGVKSFAMIFDNAGVRVPMWSMAAEQWSERPWVGAGSRSYSYECYLHWAPTLRYAEKEPVFVHNEYLQLMTDYGLVGLLLVLGVFILHGRTGTATVANLRQRLAPEGLKKGSNAMALAIAGMSGMTAMAVNICFDFRTHLLANLLLLVCCAVWVLPLLSSKSKVREGEAVVGEGQNKKNWILSLMLFILGLGAITLGGQQLWAGLPLLENRAAKEAGTWEPQEVDREVWIPMFEASLARAPQWRRYQRLSTLYMIESAEAQSPEQKQEALGLAEEACIASIERHAFSPIARINLASVYAQQLRWKQADAMYASASDRAKVREPWFGMHTQWGELHYAVALSKWHEGNKEEAHFHFTKAVDLFKMSNDYGVNGGEFGWQTKYGQCLIAYASFLDDQSSWQEAEVIYELAGKIAGAPSIQKKTRVNFHRARHFYRHGKALWQQRRPEDAYQMMLRAEKHMIQDKKYASIPTDDSWEGQMQQIQEVIRFFKLTGVAK